MIQLGYSRQAVRTLVARHELVRVFRGIYADARAPLSWRDRLRAALLAAGPTAFLSHITAASWRQLRASRPTDAIHVTVVAKSTPKIEGLVVHRISTEPPPGEVGRYLGVRASTAKRILVELGPTTATDDDLRAITGEAVSRRAIDLKRLPAHLDRHRGHRGIARVRGALHDYLPTPRGKSTLEQEIAEAIAADGRFPTPERNVLIGDADGIRFEIDFWFGDERVAVEGDGGTYHARLEAQERDRIKDAFFAMSDIRCMRITGVRWRADRAGCLDDLLAILEVARRHRRAA